MFSELFAPVSIGVRTIAKTVRILERNHLGNLTAALKKLVLKTVDDFVTEKTSELVTQ